jgi:hypothetical protein
MPGTVSKQSLRSFGRVVGYAPMQSFSTAATAVSSEAEIIRKAGFKVIKDSESSQSLFGVKAMAISEVLKLADECEENDWDGGQAMAIKDSSVGKTVAFIRALPEGVPMPEPAPEPDGCISLDWIETRHRLFSLSIGSSDRIAYAWIDGADGGHGVAQFDGSRIPPRILEGIQSIVNHGQPTLRAA